MKEEAQLIQSYLEITVSSDPPELVNRIATLMAYMARSGEMLAKAKKDLRIKKTAEISKTILKIAKENCLSASVQNALLDSICEDESFMVDWLERINRTCTHQIDGLRSLLSYEKEQMKSLP
jgi:type III secretion system FlhB-like substrate exporter